MNNWREQSDGTRTLGWTSEFLWGGRGHWFPSLLTIVTSRKERRAYLPSQPQSSYLQSRTMGDRPIPAVPHFRTTNRHSFSLTHIVASRYTADAKKYVLVGRDQAVLNGDLSDEVCSPYLHFCSLNHRLYRISPLPMLINRGQTSLRPTKWAPDVPS